MDEAAVFEASVCTGFEAATVVCACGAALVVEDATVLAGADAFSAVGWSEVLAVPVRAVCERPELWLAGTSGEESII